MQSFHIQCGTCNAKLKVSKASTIGQSLACPRCGQMVEVKAPKGWDLGQKKVKTAAASSSSGSMFEDDSIMQAIEDSPAPKTVDVAKPNSKSRKTKSPGGQPKRPAPVHPQDFQETMPREVAESLKGEGEKAGSVSRSQKGQPRKSKNSKSEMQNGAPAETAASSISSPDWQSESSKSCQKMLFVAFAGVSAVVLGGVLFFVLWNGGFGTQNTVAKGDTEKSSLRGGAPEGEKKEGVGEKNQTPKDPSESNNDAKGEGKVEDGGKKENPVVKSNDPKSNDTDDKSTEKKESQPKESNGNSSTGGATDDKVDSKNGGGVDGGFAAEVKKAQTELIQSSTKKEEQKVDSEESFFDLLKKHSGGKGAGISSEGNSITATGPQKLTYDPASSVNVIAVNRSRSRRSRDYEKPKDNDKAVDTLKLLNRVVPIYRNPKGTTQILTFLDDLEKLSGIPIWLDGESFFTNPVDLSKQYSIDFESMTVLDILKTQLPKMGFSFKQIEFIKDKPEAIGILVFPKGADAVVTKKYAIPAGIKWIPAEQPAPKADPGEKNASRSGKSKLNHPKGTRLAVNSRPSISLPILELDEDGQQKASAKKESSGRVQQETPLGPVPNQKKDQEKKDPKKPGGSAQKKQQEKDNPLSNVGKGKEKEVKKPKPKEDPEKEAAENRQREIAEFLIQLIRSNIAPNTWKGQGGEGEIRFNGTEIEVKSTLAVQKRVARFFEQLTICLKVMDGKSAIPATLQPRAQLGPGLKKVHDISFYSKRSIKDMLRQVDQETGVKTLVNWDALAKQGWTPETSVPWFTKNKAVGYSIDRLCFDMDLVYRVVGTDVVEITSKPFAEYRMDTELYSVSGVFTKDINWQILSGRLKAFFREELDTFKSCRVYYDSRIGCIVARLPQRSHRKMYAYLQKQREINKSE